MALIKVLGNEKTSLKIILAHAETAETTEIMLRTVSKHKMALIKDIGNGGDEAKKCELLKGGQKWHRICCTSPLLRDIVKILSFSFLVIFDF